MPRNVLVRRDPGQVIVMFALCVTVLLLVLGGAIDLAIIVVERGRLQNAVDSAALAAAQTLGHGHSRTEADQAAADYLARNGYTNGVNNTTYHTTFATQPGSNASTPQGASQFVDVSVAHPQETFFWRLAGVSSVTLQVHAQASSPSRRFDIFLSVDETSSMSDAEMLQLRRAARLFIQTLNLVPGDPYSPKVALSVFEGLRYKTDYTLPGTTPPQTRTVALADSLILTHLNNNPADLLTLIDGASGGGCGSLSLPADQPPMPYAAFPTTAEMSKYNAQPQRLTTGGGFPSLPPPLSRFACPLQRDANATSGTLIRNGITAAFAATNLVDPSTGAWDAFSSAHGGRDTDTDTALRARRILILMTDGTSNIVPLYPPETDCSPTENGCARGVARFGDYPATFQAADDATIQAANIAKSGPDGLPNTADDIEIFTIGFYGNGESNLVDPTPLCPAPVLTADIQARMQASRADRVMYTVSSSTAGSCDHYFPLAKGTGDDVLATTFASIAGRIKRAQLVN